MSEVAPWLQILNLVVTLLLAILRGVEFFRRGSLEAQLTKDSFFRLTDMGETLFVHAVLLCRNGPVLIRNVSIRLRRLAQGHSTTAEKSFPLEVVGHGEKIKGAAYQADHHFYGSSPLLYVNPSSTIRAVYQCLQPDYKERQQQALRDYDQEIWNQAGHLLLPREDEEFQAELKHVSKPTYEKMTGLIQLESGRYELILTIDYEMVGFPWWSTRQNTTSHISFDVDSSGLQGYHSQLDRFLIARAKKILKDSSMLLDYPVFQPTKVWEGEKAKSSTDGG